jgi:signal transduction histidine kinase
MQSPDDLHVVPDLRRYRLLQAGLDLLDQGFTVFDADLGLVAWNRAFFQLLDFPESLVFVGAPFESFMRYNARRGEYGPGDVEELVAHRMRLARAFTPHYAERARPNGQIISVRGEPLPGNGFVTLYTDITERRRYERLIQEQNAELERRVAERTAELKDAQAALVNAQKMEAVGQLTGGLAHDFNNMLTVVIGNLASLRERHVDSTEIEGFVVPAITAAQRGAILIRRLLTFTRQHPLEAHPVDIASMVSDTMVLLKRTLPEHIDITATSAAEPLHAMTDPHQLENALLNLALNARDAMPEGGRLRIDASLLQLNDEQALPFEVQAGRYMSLSVADTGTGMDAVTLARAFEPFFTTKRFGLGSGLGLSMVYGFVKQSGGGIRIESAPGAGTTVTLVLPSCEAGEQAQPMMPDPHAIDSDASDRPLVLLVEDDPGVRRVVRLQLVGLGYPVIEAANGVDAMEILNTVASVGVLVSDVVMPAGIDGRTLCRQARQAHPQIRILLISGYVADADPSELSADEDAGPPLLRKPFTVGQLQAAIEALGP